MAASFHDVLFPPNISYSSAGGPKFKTTVFSADSGYEQRNIDWQSIRCEYDVSHGLKTPDQLTELQNFFMNRRGKAYGFRYKDWSDFTWRNEPICVGNGSLTYQLTKTYVSQQAESNESYSYVRTIKKPAWNSIINVSVGATAYVSAANPSAANEYHIDYNTGLITFAQAPSGAVMAGYGEFHVPVRFDTDHLDIAIEYFETTSWQSINLVEVRDV